MGHVVPLQDVVDSDVSPTAGSKKPTTRNLCFANMVIVFSRKRAATSGMRPGVAT